MRVVLSVRFHGDHISKVLSCLFEKSKQNDAYLQSEEIKKMEQKFDELMPDEKFKAFCNQYSC